MDADPAAGSLARCFNRTAAPHCSRPRQLRRGGSTVAQILIDGPVNADKITETIKELSEVLKKLQAVGLVLGAAMFRARIAHADPNVPMINSALQPRLYERRGPEYSGPTASLCVIPGALLLGLDKGLPARSEAA